MARFVSLANKWNVCVVEETIPDLLVCLLSLELHKLCIYTGRNEHTSLSLSMPYFGASSSRLHSGHVASL